MRCSHLKCEDGDLTHLREGSQGSLASSSADVKPLTLCPQAQQQTQLRASGILVSGWWRVKSDWSGFPHSLSSWGQGP